MANLALQDVHAALERAANIIREAAGKDGIVSKKDIRNKLKELRGAERALVDVFYRFIDHRDAQKGSRILENDIQEALTYAKEKIIDKYDLNKDGLSDDEIAGMSATGQLAVQLARQLKRTGDGAAFKTSRELFDRIAEFTPGLIFDDLGSEGSQEVTPFIQEANVGLFTERAFAYFLKLDQNDPKEMVERFMPADEELLQRFIDVNFFVDKTREAQQLVELLAKNLVSLSVAIVGEDSSEVDPAHPVYIVGIGNDGFIVGIQSFVIWT